MTGHRGPDWEAGRWEAIGAGTGRLLDGILDAVGKASRQPFFREAPARVRVISMLAEGADQLVSAAGLARGVMLHAVLPAGNRAYEETMSGQDARQGFRSLLARASAVTVLGDEAVSDAAFERANSFILAQADLLIALWDGLPARGRGGTAEVVQKALDGGIPVFVVETEPAGGVSSVRRPGDVLLPGTAADLPRFEADGEVERAVARIMLPPASSRQREAFLAMLKEPERPKQRRFEYWLITWLGGSWGGRRWRRGDDARLEQPREARGGGARQALRSAFERVDALATHYGTLTRSSEASQFLLLALAACLSAGLALFFPGWQVVGSLVQIAVSGVILADSTLGKRRRWYERWTDYRSLAERIRCMRFLHPSGQTILAARPLRGDAPQSWTGWFAARLARSVEPAEGLFSAARIEAGYREVQSEAADQIAYHRRLIATTVRLDRRLDWAARLSLAGVIAASAVQLASTVLAAPADPSVLAIAATVATLATVILSSARGLRSSVNTAGTVRRSQLMVVRLAKLLRLMREHRPSLDRLMTSAALAAAAMIDDFGTWHTSLATRRPAKLRRPGLIRRSRGA